MKDIKTANWPTYRLLKQSDVVSFFHLQLPQWLFFDAKYLHLSLESKVAYTFLLNRYQLSRMNGWVNEDGEVFIIYPREKLAEEIGISYRKAISCFKELLTAGLIWEHRVGRGAANRIYMAAVELSRNNGSADIQEVPNQQIKTCDNGISRHADSVLPDMPFSHTRKIDNIKTDKSDTEKVSPSRPAREEQADDEYSLEDIIENCEFEVLPDEDAGVFRNAVTRLFYSDSFRIGSAVLPRQVIRSHLHKIDGVVLMDTREKLRRNKDKEIKNSTAYVMTTLLNNVWEVKSDLMVDPYLNQIGAS